jgi:hypothetical protein
MTLAVRRTLDQHNQIYILQTLALIEAPILIPTFQQISPVEIKHCLQDL